MSSDPFELAIELHVTQMEVGKARLWGRKLYTLVPSWGNHTVELIPTLMPPDRYNVHLGALTEAPEDGWVTMRLGLEVNALHLGFKPVAFYVGERTDWASGIVRFAQPFDEAGPHRAFLGHDPHEPRQTVQGPVWCVTLRRNS